MRNRVAEKYPLSSHSVDVGSYLPAIPVAVQVVGPAGIYTDKNNIANPIALPFGIGRWLSHRYLRCLAMRIRPTKNNRTSQ